MKHVCIIARKKLRYNARVNRQAKSLSEAGYKVTVIALAEEGLPRWERTPYCEIFRINLIGANMAASGESNAPGERPPLYGRAKYELARMALEFFRGCNSPVDFVFGLKALRMLRGNRADIYCSHDSYPLITSFMISRLHKARLVYDAVEFSPDRNVPRGPMAGFVSSLQIWIESRIVKRVDAVFTVGDSIASLMSEYYKISKPTVVRNCPEYEASITPKQVVGSSGKDVIIYAGSITTNNGLEQLIRAMRYTNNAVAVILGPGMNPAFERKLAKLIKELDMGDKVQIMKPVEQGEVVQCLASADVGVIPIQKNCLNHIHASPNKLYEYIAARIPVATGDFPTVTPLVREYGIGEIFDETSPESIGNTLNRMLANKDSYKEALESCAGILCWENEAPKMIEALEGLEQP